MRRLTRGEHRQWFAVGATTVLVALSVSVALRPGPAGRLLSFATVATAFVHSGQPGLAASVDLRELQTRLDKLRVCPHGCFAEVQAPAGVVLAAFSPATTVCAAVSGVTARLVHNKQLRISTSLHHCHVRQGAMLPEGSELLLAFPMPELPVGPLSITVSSHGDSSFGTPTTSTEVSVR